MAQWFWKQSVCMWTCSALDHSRIVSQLLLLLVHQQYLWGSPFWVRFLCMWLFFNPNIEVVTFPLRGRCLLVVFLLPAFTCLRDECQDLQSLCDGIHMCTGYTLVYTLIWKSFWGMESEPMLTPKEKSPKIEPTMLHQAGQRAQHTTNELFQPYCFSTNIRDRSSTKITHCLTEIVVWGPRRVLGYCF